MTQKQIAVIDFSSATTTYYEKIDTFGAPNIALQFSWTGNSSTVKDGGVFVEFSPMNDPAQLYDSTDSTIYSVMDIDGASTTNGTFVIDSASNTSDALFLDIRIHAARGRLRILKNSLTAGVLTINQFV
ncbi:MAG: hypothetical protein GY853_14325 [PVC group bacterium]|nr:hypothetical protein [PVC group bacterium]